MERFNASRPLSGDHLQRWPIFLLHIVLDGYRVFLERELAVSIQQEQRLVDALDKAKRLIASISSEESPQSVVTAAGDNQHPHRERAWLLKAINSGVVRLRPLVTASIAEAYSLVQTFAPHLRDLPLEQIQRSELSGLASDFAQFVAILVAAKNLIFPRQFNKDKQFKVVKMAKHDIMTRLKQYRFGRAGLLGEEFNVWRDLTLTRGARSGSLLGLFG